jgi:hypothetical protein
MKVNVVICGFLTFTDTWGMSHSGRFSPFPVQQVNVHPGISERQVSALSGRLAAAYIINGLTTGTDPKQKYSITVRMTGTY